MASDNKVADIALDDLVIGKSQVRVREVGAEIDELAASINKMGLLEPIVVCPAETKGKYEILTGQRRFLAHKQLGRSTIQAMVLPERVDDATAKALSLTENLVRRDLSSRDLIDACTALYKKYGTIEDVVEETGLPRAKVAQYVKYERLSKKVQKLVDQGVVDIKTALRATDAASAGGDYDEDEAVKFATEMATVSGAQQQKMIKQRNEDPTKSADEVIEAAKSADKIVQINIKLGAEVHRSLQAFAKNEGSTQDSAAADLIEESLRGKGFLEE
jgi:ParB family transcriptional regulator, chromosome partitioning protein